MRYLARPDTASRSKHIVMIHVLPTINDNTW